MTRHHAFPQDCMRQPFANVSLILVEVGELIYLPNRTTLRRPCIIIAFFRAALQEVGVYSSIVAGT